MAVKFSLGSTLYTFDIVRSAAQLCLGRVVHSTRRVVRALQVHRLTFIAVDRATGRAEREDGSDGTNHSGNSSCLDEQRAQGREACGDQC